MPHPLHHHVADCFVRVIRTRIIIPLEMEDRIRIFIHAMPVRVSLDLLHLVGDDIATIPIEEDSMVVDSYLTNLHTPYQEKFHIILNEIRIIGGEPSWFPENSYMREDGIEVLRRMRDIELNGGISHSEREYLYRFASELVADLNNPNDDDEDDDNISIASVDSDATAITIPLEDPLEDCADLTMVF